MTPERRTLLLDLLARRGVLLRITAAAIDRAAARCAGIGQKRPGGSARALTQPESASARLALAQFPASASHNAARDGADAHGATASNTASNAGASDTMPDPPTGERSAVTDPGILAPGLILAGYRIDGLLGRGGMGQVYRATQLSMNRTVALKVLAEKLAANRRIRERFVREARAAGRLHHPHLITVHDVGEADGRMYFSMELVEGRSLRQRLAEGPLPIDEALDYTRQMLEALRYAHAQGIIHRDVKPDNLMIAEHGAGAAGRKPGTLKLADLGLSRLDDQHLDASATGQFTTQAGAILGTPHYMAPEQGRDSHHVDCRADLYSVGATLYHLVTGSPPFTAATPMAVILAAARQPLTFPEPGPPLAVRRLIECLMAKDPAARPDNAETALVLLSNVQAGKVPTLVHPARTRRRFWRWTAILFVLAALACATGPILDVWRWRGDRVRIQSLSFAGRYADALRLIDTVRERQSSELGWPIAAWLGADALAQARSNEVTALRNDLLVSWDRIALSNVQGKLRDAQAQLPAHPELVAGLLKDIPDADRSPAVDASAAALSEQAQTALVAALEEAQRQGRALPPHLRDFASRSGDWWNGFRSDAPSTLIGTPAGTLSGALAQASGGLPPGITGTLAVDGAVAVLTGSGSANRTLPALSPRAGWSALRGIPFTCELIPPASAAAGTDPGDVHSNGPALWFVLANERRIGVDTRGAFLQTLASNLGGSGTSTGTNFGMNAGANSGTSTGSNSGSTGSNSGSTGSNSAATAGFVPGSAPGMNPVSGTANPGTVQRLPGTSTAAFSTAGSPVRARLVLIPRPNRPGTWQFRFTGTTDPLIAIDHTNSPLRLAWSLPEGWTARLSIDIPPPSARSAPPATPTP